MQMRRFPEKIRSLRKKYSMTQQELADRLGLVQSHIYYLETGKRKPSIDVVLKIVELFHVTPDQLLLDDVELPFD